MCSRQDGGSGLASVATRRAKASLLDALLTDDPALADYVFNFYLDDYEYTDAYVKKVAAKRGIELPPSKVWGRYEDPFDARLARYLDQAIEKGRRSIGFDVRLDGNRISAVDGLDSEASAFVSHFRIGTTLVTNLLSESRPAFVLTGKDATTLCRRLTEGLQRHPGLGRELRNRIGWFFEAVDLQRLLA